MKKTIAIFMIMLCVFSITGCEREYERFRHEYEGVVGIKARKQIGSHIVRIIHYVDCGDVTFDKYDGDEEFETFLMQNLGKKVKITVDVIAKEDHEASYGTYEIISYEVIE